MKMSKSYSGKRTFSAIRGGVTVRTQHINQQNQTRCMSLALYKSLFNCIKDLNLKPEALKLLWENIEEQFQDIGLARAFLYIYKELQ